MVGYIRQVSKFILNVTIVLYLFILLYCILFCFIYLFYFILFYFIFLRTRSTHRGISTLYNLANLTVCSAYASLWYFHFILNKIFCFVKQIAKKYSFHTPLHMHSAHFIRFSNLPLSINCFALLAECRNRSSFFRASRQFSPGKWKRYSPS